MKLVKFSTSWCRECKKQKPDFEAFLLTYKLSHDELDGDDKELTDQYNVRNLPMYILIDDAKEVYRTGKVNDLEEFMKSKKEGTKKEDSKE